MTEENFRKKLLSCLSVEGVVEAKKMSEVQTVIIQDETKTVSNIAETGLKKSLSKEFSGIAKIEKNRFSHGHFDETISLNGL